MKNNNKNGKEKVVNFFKKNAYYLVMVLCLIAIITMVTVAVVNINEQPVDKIEPDKPVIVEPDKPIVKPDVKPDVPVVVEPDMNFILPVANAEIVGRYTEDNTLTYNPILDEYSFHKGVDFKTDGKAPVNAVLDGEVVTAKKHKMYGYVVEIKHAKDIVTIYRSLDDLQVKAGDTVKKGDVIGYTSNSDISESNLNEHLHFEMTEAGATINPNKYLVYEEK